MLGTNHCGIYCSPYITLQGFPTLLDITEKTWSKIKLDITEKTWSNIKFHVLKFIQFTYIQKTNIKCHQF